MENSNYSYDFLKEQVNRMNKSTLSHNNNYTYMPDNKVSKFTPKFYSQYEANEWSKIPPEKWSYYMNLSSEQLESIPQRRYKAPVTESQEIGWASKPLFNYKNDIIDNDLFHHPIVNTELTKVGLTILFSKATERPKFTGLLFRL